MKLHFSLDEGKAVIKEFNLSPCPVENIKEGDIIDLGGITLEVIEAPGHTKGSICLLNKEDRILFSGDTANGYLWMFLEESTSLKEMTDTLMKLMDIQDKFDYILTGHGSDLEEKEVIKKIYDGIIEVINGNTQNDVDDECIGIKCKVHTYGNDNLKLFYKNNI